MSNISITKFVQLKSLSDLSQKEINHGMLEIKLGEAVTRQHLMQAHFGENPIEQDNPCLQLITCELYTPPTVEQLQSVIDLLMSRGLKKTHICKNLGINSEGSRTLNYWLNPDKDRSIPYAAWRLLLALAGLSMTTMIVNNEVKTKLAEKTIKEYLAEQNSFQQ